MSQSEARAYPYIWAWGMVVKRNRAGRHFVTRMSHGKGMRCRVVCRGAMNSALIEFEDGYRTVTSRNGLRRT
jgi:hypothetical protein